MTSTGANEWDASHNAGLNTHYYDVIMGAMASQITGITLVYSEADQGKHQSSAALAFVREITGHRWIPRTNGQKRGKCFHLMTSSCNFFSLLDPTEDVVARYDKTRERNMASTLPALSNWSTFPLHRAKGRHDGTMIRPTYHIIYRRLSARLQ